MDKTPHDLKQADRPVASRKARRDSDDTVTMTHPERVVYPEDGITKGDVAAYYQAVMPWLLPGLQQRPLSVVRCPEGIGEGCFFQKHPIQGLHHVGLVKLKEESGARQTYMYAEDASSVIELVQFGTLEFHAWGATVKQTDQADQIVFDLDPAPDVDWATVVAAARLLKRMLDALKLCSFVRLSGGKGLHVVVPLQPSATWPEAKQFAHAMAATLAKDRPGEFIDSASKAKRKGKIFIDYLRNSRGATSVVNYSLRARPGAPVATPLRWEELKKVARGDAFDIQRLPKRLARLRKDPWEGFTSVKPSLKEALKTLARRD
jgi:bifunctional non-homologous end joining protein LigD